MQSRAEMESTIQGINSSLSNSFVSASQSISKYFNGIHISAIPWFSSQQKRLDITVLVHPSASKKHGKEYCLYAKLVDADNPNKCFTTQFSPSSTAVFTSVPIITFSLELTFAEVIHDLFAPASPLPLENSKFPRAARASLTPRTN